MADRLDHSGSLDRAGQNATRYTWDAGFANYVAERSSVTVRNVVYVLCQDVIYLVDGFNGCPKRASGIGQSGVDAMLAGV